MGRAHRPRGSSGSGIFFCRGNTSLIPADRDFSARFLFEAARESRCAGASEQCRPLRNELHLPALLPHFPEFLKLVARAAPAPLAAFAKQLQGSRDAARISELLAAYWENGGRHEPALDEPSTFCARAFLQPYAELLASQHAMPPAIVRRMVCPLCDGAPQLSVMRPEGDGGKRTLLCAFCAAEWDFTRIVCPACGEEDEKKVCFYTADEPKHIRVEACETCKNLFAKRGPHEKWARNSSGG